MASDEQIEGVYVAAVTPFRADATYSVDVDAYLTYVIDDYFLRVAAGYSHADMGTTPTSNAVYLGVQMQR